MNGQRTVWLHGQLPDDLARLVAALAYEQTGDAVLHWAGRLLEDLDDYTDGDVEEHDTWPDLAPGDALVVDASGMALTELAARLQARTSGMTVVLREACDWESDVCAAQIAPRPADATPAVIQRRFHAREWAWLHTPASLGSIVARGIGRVADYWVGNSAAPDTCEGWVMSVYDVVDLGNSCRCEWPEQSLFVIDGRDMTHEEIGTALEAVPLTDGMMFQRTIDISEPNGNRVLVLRNSVDLGRDARVFAPREP